MKSKYVYEDPMELMAEALEVLKKARKTTAINCMLSENENDKRINKAACCAIKTIEAELPEVLEYEREDT